MENEYNQRVGDYEILGTLGAGGMGKVYRVRNVISDRIEAMKILLPSLSEHREVGERFLREIKMVASLHHPNIANLCTAMAIDNQLIMVMEFVDGESFSDLIDSAAIPTANALNYFDQCLAALSYAHGKGIVHRDLKPSNIMLTDEGVVKLMDFGIARGEADRALTQTGATIGTVSYMSPEQIAGKPTDARSDLYSMGIFFYETVTGVQPFKGDSDYELMVAHMQQMPRRPIELVAELPAGLNDIIMKMLAKAPADRFQTAEEVRTALRALEGFESVPRGLGRPRPVSAATTNPAIYRPATMMEGALSRPNPRNATVVESAYSGTMIRDSFSDRRMTEVVGVSPYAAPPPTALVTQKRGFAKHPVLYLGGSLAFMASAVALPLIYTSHHHDGEKTAAVTSTANPAPGTTAGATAAVPAPTQPGAPPNPGIHGASPSNMGQRRPGMPPANAHVKMAVVVAGQPIAANQPAAVNTTAPAITPELRAQLDEEELTIDQLSNRATGINNSLNTMQRNMQHDGVSMRGDIAAKQSSMNTNLAKAKQALAMNDAARASKFASLAESDTGELEKFLGH